MWAEAEVDDRWRESEKQSGLRLSSVMKGGKFNQNQISPL
jgi:hypothetical protein